MKKKILMILMGILLIITVVLMNLNTNNKINKKLIVAEVTHSVFYAPWYVALNNNYFDDLDIEVVLTSGANNVISAVLSGDADIGLCGAEATIYVNKELDDKVKSFSALTKRDGQFLILRNNIEYKDIKDIEGLTILAGRNGGMPLLSFKTALENVKVNNVNIDSSIDFANLSASFISGIGDGVNLFEPNASRLVNEGYGYIATMVGTYAGIVPYTTFNAKESYINDNKDNILKFYNGINKGLEYVHTHTPLEIAEIIKNEFPDTDIDELASMIEKYKDNDSWFESSKLTKESFDNLQNILISNNEINAKLKYKDLVYEFN